MSAGPIVIIGGGIVGLSCAYALQQQGKDVVICDRQELGREASWAGAGILSPLYPPRYPATVSVLARWSARKYRDLAQELVATTGIDIEYLRSGLIVVDPAANGVENDPNAMKHWGEDAQKLERNDLKRHEPALVFDTESAVLLPSVCQIRNPRLMMALRQVISAKGRVLEGVTASGFEVIGSTLKAIKTSAGVIPTSQCIVAAGAWSAGLLETVGLHIPVKPIRGQMLLIAAQPGYLRHIVVYRYRYLVPRRDGGILVGSTLEDVGFDKSTTEEGRELLHRSALELVPTLEQFHIQAHWAGLRPGSPDSLPYIGEHPEIRGLYVCTGHHRNGLALAPATAQITLDLMLGRAPEFDPTPFRLDRPLASTVRPTLQSHL